MNTFTKNSLQLCLISFLAATLATHAMEMQLRHKIKFERPTIKATVYFVPESPAFYATKRHIEYLNDKDISTPIQPVARMVSKVIVHKDDKKQTNWLYDIPFSIENYHLQSLKHNHPQDCIKGSQKKRKILLKTFPFFLPAELAFNCTNGSKINLTIEKFPVDVTFASKNDFYAEHQKCLSDFFEKPDSISTKEEAKDLVASGKLSAIEIPGFVTRRNHLVPVTYIDYTHGPNGCPDEKEFVQSIMNDKIPTRQSQYKALMNREMTGSFK